MSNLAEIVLPPGTLKIPVVDVPELIAEAIHPDLPADAPRFLTSLAKQSVSEDGSLSDDEPLTGADRVAEEKLLAAMDRDAGAEVDYDTDWGLLEAIWTGLPGLSLPLRETDWQQYATAFENSPLRPSWRLIAVWESPNLLNYYSQAFTRIEHEKALDLALLTGEVVPRSSLSLLPTPGLMGNQLNHAFLTVEDLRRYAAKYCIAVSVAEAPAKYSLLREAESPSLRTIDWEFWRAMPNAKYWQACALSLSIDPDSLKPSPNAWMAGPGSGPIFESKSFPSREAEERFDKRLRLLVANRYDEKFFTLPMAKFSNLGPDEVRLHEFAAWALSVGWSDVPQELTSLAQNKAVPAPAAPSIAMDLPDRSPEDQAKYERAWSLYDELDKWEGMKHQDDPIRAKMIDTELARIRAELAQIDSPTTLVAAATSQVPREAHARPAEQNSKSRTSITHRVGNREPAILTAEIVQAKANAPDPGLVASVWGELTKLAEQRFGVLVGVVPEGIQYRGKKPRDDGGFDVFTLRSLRERMTREAASERA